MAWRAERKRWLQPSEEGRERPERKSARSQAKLDALEITKHKIEPPPSGWEWPAEHDAIEVEVEDSFGITAWQKAQVLTVLVDGWFQARITTRSDSWDDWFNWSEEGSDWRRKAKHAPLAVRGPHKRERSEPRRPAERREGWLEGGVSTAGGEVRVDPSKLRLRLDRAKREAMLLPSLSVPKRFTGRPARGQKPMRLDLPEGSLPFLSVDDSLIGQRVRCLSSQLLWDKGSIVGFDSATGRHTVRFDAHRRGEDREMQVTLLDHRVDILIDVSPFPPLDEDDAEERYLSEAESSESEEGEEAEQMLCGRDGCTMPAWHAGMCMPALEEEEEEGSVRRSRRALAPPRPPSLLSGPEVNKTSREVERQQRRGGVVNKAEEKPAGLRLVTSRLARSGFRHVRALPYGAGLSDDVDPPNESSTPTVYAIRLWQRGKQKALGPFDTAVDAAAAYSRFVIQEFEEEAAAAAAAAAASKAAARRASAAIVSVEEQPQAVPVSKREVDTDDGEGSVGGQVRLRTTVSREDRYEARKREISLRACGSSDSSVPANQPVGQITAVEVSEQPERHEKLRSEKSEKTFYLPETKAKSKKQEEGYDDSVVGRRVRAFRDSDGTTCNGTIVERVVMLARNARYRISYDDGVEEELLLPDEAVILLPKDDGGFDENSSLSLEEQRKAWAAEAYAAEIQAKEEQAMDGITLFTSSKTDTGYRCVQAVYLSRLGVFAYEVRAKRDGRCVHIGRFKSKRQAAVAFARYMATGDSASKKESSNMAIEPMLPESTKEDGINTIEKILDVRTVEVDCLLPPPQPVLLPTSLPRRTREGVSSLAEGCDIVEALGRCRRTKQSVAVAASGDGLGGEWSHVVSCQEGHMMACDVPTEEVELRCDACAVKIPAGDVRFSCSSCDFDLCFTCGGHRVQRLMINQPDVTKAISTKVMHTQAMNTEAIGRQEMLGAPFDQASDVSRAKAHERDEGMLATGCTVRPHAAPGVLKSEVGSPEKMASEEGVPVRLASEEGVPVQMASEKAVPEHMASDGGSLQQMASEERVPEQASEEGVLEQMASEGGSLEHMASEEGLPQQMVQPSLTREQGLQEQKIQNEVVRETILAEQMGTAPQLGKGGSSEGDVAALGCPPTPARPKPLAATIGGIRQVPVLGEILQVEVEEHGVVKWIQAEVRQVLPSQRFFVCVENDEDFIESYGMGDEFKEWRRTGTVTDLFNREIVKDELQEYLCKMRGYSYRRCKWISTEEIEDDGPLSSNILKKFQKKLAAGEPVDTSYKKYMTIDRVISHRRRRGQLEFLVKPCGLPYAECSWERAPSLIDSQDKLAVDRYYAACQLNPSSLTLTSQAAHTSWLKSGTNVEIASVSEQGIGFWSIAKVLESAEGKALVVVNVPTVFQKVTTTSDPTAESGEQVVKHPCATSRRRERVGLERLRPVPPRTPKDFRALAGQVVQGLEGGVWRVGMLKAVRNKGEQLLDDDKFFQLRREQARKRAALQASLQPIVRADTLPIGSRMEGRDGKLWEVITDRDQAHCWLPQRQVKPAGQPGGYGSKRRRCGTCQGCLKPNCGVCKYCLDMPKFGGSGTLRQTCEQRACLQLIQEDREDRERRKQERSVKLMAERKAKQEERQIERRSSRLTSGAASMPADGGTPNALVKERYRRSEVAGKRVIVDYEEENEAGVTEIVRYPGVIVSYDVRDGLLVHFDGYAPEEMVYVEEDGEDDWEWEEPAGQLAGGEGTRARVEAGASEVLGREKREGKGKEGSAMVGQSLDPHTASRSSGLPRWRDNRGEAADDVIMEQNDAITASDDGIIAAHGIKKSELETIVAPAATVALAAGESGQKPSDGLVKGKKRSKVSGSRVVVDYEEEGEDGEVEIKRYPGVVLAYSTSHGLCVRFDGYADDDEEGEAWVEEAGVDDWDWEENAMEYAKEAMHLFVDEEGEKWKTVKELRPNWVWWSVEDGWSIDDEETSQECFSAAAERPSSTGTAEDTPLDGEDLLTSAERVDKRKMAPNCEEILACDSVGSDAADAEPFAEAEEDMPPQHSDNVGSLARPRHDRDDDYCPGQDNRGSSGEGSDEDMEPTEVSGWNRLDESPAFLCNGCKLRSYQLDGLNWMRLSYYLGRNIILGDEMGLGKTAQSVSLLQSLRSIEGVEGPFLIVAPLSTLPHWERELSLWTDLYWVNFHGSADSRRVVQQYEWYQSERLPKGQEKYRFHVLLCNYETVVQDPDALLAIKWHYLIVDEGHRLKNRHSRSLEVMSELRTRRKMVLSGTPLQNDISELWTIMNFLEPAKFDNFNSFLGKFGSLSSGGGTAKQVERLNKLLKPHLLRREKEDVEHSLPGMKETLLYVEITNLQKMCYRAVLERNREILLRGAGSAGMGPSFNNVSMMLRHCCNHPWLIPDVEDGALIQLDAEWEAAASTGAIRADDDTERTRRYTDRLVASSGKFVLLQKLLPKLKSDGHRVLIFSQFTKVLDLFEDFLDANHFSFERLDGSVSGAARQQAIDRFSDHKSECFIFLLSTRAGGQGINLTAADTVIVFDPDWNPQNDVQAMARCHRIGQTRAVQVYKLCTKGTYENHMLVRSNHKLGLEHAIMRTGEHGEKALTSTGFARSTKATEVAYKERTLQIEQLLKSGAQCLEAEQDEEAVAFSQSSIEEILSHYVEVINEEGESMAGQKKLGSGSTFSRATIVSEGGGSIDMADPNFWEKMLPGDSSALVADKAMASKLSGADRIKGLKLMDFEDPGKSRRVSEFADEERSARSRARMPTAGKTKAVRERRPDGSRASVARWDRDELASMVECMLAFGHIAAPERAVERAEKAGGCSARSLSEYQLVADYLLAITLLKAAPALRARWLPPLGLHTKSDASLVTPKETKKPRPSIGQFHVNQRDVVTACGGMPRPKGRPPLNDQGYGLVWSFVRGKWVDCTKGGTYKGAQLSENERQEVLAENKRFASEMKEAEARLYEEWLHKREASKRGDEHDAEAKPALETEGAMQDEDAAMSISVDDERVDHPAEDGTEGSPNGSGVPDMKIDCALRQLEMKARPSGDVEWLLQEADSRADEWLVRLLEHRQALAIKETASSGPLGEIANSCQIHIDNDSGT